MMGARPTSVPQPSPKHAPAMTTPPGALPEGRWLWRRLYVFSATLGLWLLLRQTVSRTPPDRLPQLADGLIHLLALILVLYLVAPTAQQLIEMLAALRLRISRGLTP